jgi:hypothetical protein
MADTAAIPDTVAAPRLRPATAVAPRVITVVAAPRATVAAHVQPRLLMAAGAPHTAVADHTVADRMAVAATVGIANDILSARLSNT